MASETARIDGIAMRWEDSGEGLPLVLIHGIPTSPSLWRHVVPRIAGARCLAFEMVGYGQSIPEGRERDISVGRQAEYLVSWLRHLGIDSAVLAGHDLGGGVAQIAAVRHPGLVTGLFLTNAIGYDSWPIPSVKAMRAAGWLIGRLPDVAAKQVVRTLMLRGHDDRAKADEALEIHWRPYARHDGAAALIRQMKALNVQDTLSVAEELPKLKMPARIVWGAADQFQKVSYGERFAGDLRAPLTRIDGGKHFTPEDRPDIVADAINELVAAVRQRGPDRPAQTCE